MTDLSTTETEDPTLPQFTDGELRFLRKTVSMQQGHLESRMDHADAAEKVRIRRDVQEATTAYAKLQGAINARLLGDDDA